MRFSRRVLTGAVSELKAQVGTAEAFQRDGQLEGLAPAWAVVVVKHKGAMLIYAGLTAAHTQAVLHTHIHTHTHTHTHTETNKQTNKQRINSLSVTTHIQIIQLAGNTCVIYTARTRVV